MESFSTVLSVQAVIIHGLSICISVAAFIFAPKILSIGRGDASQKLPALVLRLCLTVYFLFEVVDILLLHALPEYDRILYKAALSILTIFVAVIFRNLFTKWARRRFGSEKKIDGDVVTVETYYSQITSLLFSIMTSIMVLYLFVQIWEMNSLLETTGFVGLIAAMLVFTNSIWLPDLYYGLIILNSDMISDGDAIMMDSGGPIYVINRVSLVYTSLINIETNNKALIRNSKFFENKLENLTKRASIEGLRQCLTFKVSYPEFSGAEEAAAGNELNSDAEVERFYHKIESMFSKACDEVQQTCEKSIAANSEFDWGLLNAGDYALEFVLHYYLAPLPSTKLGKKLRKVLYGTRQQVIYSVYKQSIRFGIDLSTPTLLNIGSSLSADTHENAGVRRQR